MKSKACKWVALSGAVGLIIVAAAYPPLAEKAARAAPPVRGVYTGQIEFAFTETEVNSAGITTLGLPATETLRLYAESSIISFEVCNSDATYGPGGALSDLDVYFRPHGDAEWHQYIDSTLFAGLTALGYATQGSQLVKFITATGPHEVDTNGCAAAVIKVPPSAEVQFRAASDRGATGVTVRGTVGFD